MLIRLYRTIRLRLQLLRHTTSQASRPQPRQDLRSMPLQCLHRHRCFSNNMLKNETICSQLTWISWSINMAVLRIWVYLNMSSKHPKLLLKSKLITAPIMAMTPKKLDSLASSLSTTRTFLLVATHPYGVVFSALYKSDGVSSAANLSTNQHSNVRPQKPKKHPFSKSQPLSLSWTIFRPLRKIIQRTKKLLQRVRNDQYEVNFTTFSLRKCKNRERVN